MINIKKYCLLIITFVILHSVVLATGPSWIESKIRPISINENGDVLCRTRFSKNEMGAQKAMKVIYGYCIITSDTIIQYKTQEIEPNGLPDLNMLTKVTEYWDLVFYSCFDIRKLSEIGYEIKNHYNFKSCNIASYKVDKRLKIVDLENTRKFDFDDNPQKALNGAFSREYYNEKTIHILYDFGNILILKNEENMEGSKSGASFNYRNSYCNMLTDKNGMGQDTGFDISLIHGVLIIK